MAARWLTAGFTLGISEAVRAVDPQTADALCDNNPLGAVANCIENGSAGPLVNAVRVDRVLTQATRNVPVANSVTSAVTSVGNYGEQIATLPLNVGGLGILHRGPQQTPDSWAYACALVANEAYQDWSQRKSTLIDKEGWEWKELPDWKANKLSVYTHDRVCIIGLRGTADGADVAQDLDLAFYEGLIHATHSGGRTRFSCQKVRELVGTYDTVYLTGHSLGGFLAFQLAIPHRNVKAHIFNAGANGFNPFHHSAYQFLDLTDRVWHHHIRGDIVSAGFSEAYAQRVEYNCSFAFAHAHQMGHFILPEHRQG